MDTFYTGPYSNRTPTKVSFIEFGSSDMAFQFCKHVKDTKNSKVSISGCEITVKAARTKINDQRNYSIRKANELIGKHANAQNKTVKIEWGDREVIVDRGLASKQNKTYTSGTFAAPFDDIHLG